MFLCPSLSKLVVPWTVYNPTSISHCQIVTPFQFSSSLFTFTCNSNFASSTTHIPMATPNSPLICHAFTMLPISRLTNLFSLSTIHVTFSFHRTTISIEAEIYHNVHYLTSITYFHHQVLYRVLKYNECKIILKFQFSSQILVKMKYCYLCKPLNYCYKYQNVVQFLKKNLVSS